MKYKKYPSYKDSGVEWLGDIPSQWDIIYGKRLFTNRREQSKADDSQLAVTQKFGVIPQSVFMKKEGQKVVLALKGTENFRHVEQNDYVISLRSFQGGIEYSKYNGCVSPAYTVLSNNKIIDFKYYKLLFKSAPYILALQASTDSLREGKSITYDQFGTINIPIPPLQEQKAIANFLDKVTDKIDTLIEKQERLIELLKEKRQAVISHAVSRGLDPNVKMKDSGVEWLGEVPEHWKVSKLKYIGEAVIGLTYSPNDIVDENEGTLVLRSTNIQNGQLVYNSNVYVNTNIPEKLITKEKDIVICSRNGSRNLIGKNAIVTKESSGLSFGAFTTVFRSKYNNYIFYILNSSLFSFQSGRFLTTTINQLTTGTLNMFEIPFPPVVEQQSIANYLDDKTSKIDTLIDKSTKSIELLKEKRTALISAAVTGKIDVRETYKHA